MAPTPRKEEVRVESTRPSPAPLEQKSADTANQQPKKDVVASAVSTATVPPVKPATQPTKRPPPLPEKPSRILELFLAVGVRMELVRIEPGTFLMGSKDEKGREDDETQH